MTLDQAMELVWSILRKTSRGSADADPRTQLEALGISNAALRLFKKALVEALRSRSIFVSMFQLRISEASTLDHVAAMLVETSQFAETVGMSGTLTTETPPIKRGIDDDRKRGIAKKAAAKETVAKKAVAKKDARRGIDKSVLKGREGKIVGRVGARPLPKGKARLSDAARAYGDLYAEEVPLSAEEEVGKSTAESTSASWSRPDRLQDTWRERGSDDPPGSSAPSEDAGYDAVVAESEDSAHDDLVERDGFEDDDESDDIQAAAAPTPTIASRVLICTPQMEMVERKPAKNVYALELYLNQGEAPEGAQVHPVRIEYLEGVAEVPVEVWFDCSSHLSLDIPQGDLRLIVNTEIGISDRIRFKLHTTDDSTEGPMYVSAFFRYEDRPCGKITRFLTRTPKGLKWSTPTRLPATPGEVTLPRDLTPPALKMEMTAKPADIRIEVLKTEANDGQHFTLHCGSGAKFWDGPWNLPQITKEFVNNAMERFMLATGKARIAGLQAAGVAFWEALPAGARAFLLDAIEEGAKSIAILSEEPYIPWELMVPYRTLKNKRQPLGIDLNVGRWVTGDYLSAPQAIPMRSIHIVCPRESGLKTSTTEMEYLIGLGLSPADPILPVDFNGVDVGLSGPQRDIVHFICHGKSDASIQTLQLEEPDVIDCGQVKVMDGFLHAFEKGALAFLNACEVGSTTLALDGIGGFANSFIELGASGVIAPLWAVQDSTALEVSKIFYSEALKGRPFSEIMKSIRAKAYDLAIDSYAAYCFYGDPGAHVALPQ